MGIVRRIIRLLGGLLWQKKAGGAANIAEKLSPESLEQVRKEADFLRVHHAVHVRDMEEDELPSLPRKAQD